MAQFGFLLRVAHRIHPQFVNYGEESESRNRRLPAKLAWTWRQLGQAANYVVNEWVDQRRAKEESRRGEGCLKVFYVYAKRCRRPTSLHEMCRPIKGPRS